MKNKLLLLLMLTTLIWGCGEDGGEDPSTPDVGLEGNWIDETVAVGTDNDGFIVLDFDEAASNATIFAATDNNAGVFCGEVLFRNITTSGENTLDAEGFINLGFGAEYVPVTMTLVDDNTINIDWDCSGCTPAVDVITRIPDRSEAVPVEINANIEEETTLYNLICDPNEADYVVTENIGVFQVLTIEPGVVIEFEANAGMTVRQFSDGALIAKGASSDPIIFTGVEKTKGYWRGLRFQTNDVRNELDYVIVEYAGSDELADDINGGVNAGISIDVEPGGEVARLKLTNSTIRENDGYGLAAEWFSEIAEFSNNTFENNTNAAVLLETPNVAALDAASNYTGGNGYEGVEIAGNASGNELFDNATWTAFDDGSTYYVSRSIGIRSQLTIQPGALFEFEANTFMVFEIDQFGPNDGVIIANGTSSDPITFTGFQKTAGYWRGLIITSNSNLNNMQHCVVEYGGSDEVAGRRVNIALDKNGAFDPPKLTITNSVIRNSAGCGIVVDQFGGDLTQSDNTFSGNAGDDICN